jgi:hypothetical protein
MKRYILSAALALLIPIGFAYLGGTKLLGAHNWWDIKTIIIGAPIGIILAFVIGLLPIKKLVKVIGFLILTCLAFWAAKHGQTAFANSYGDDQFAGKLWYFGWIATGLFSAATIFSATR